MNDQDIIRKAVELADGWGIHPGMTLDKGATDFFRGPTKFVSCRADKPIPQYFLDALAAQLVRQVESSGDNYDYGFFSVSQFCDAGQFVTEVLAEDGAVSLSVVIGPDRTMNTLRAIVESGVLE